MSNKHLLRLLELSGMEPTGSDDNIYDALVKYFQSNPKPSDEEFHQFARKLNLTPEKLEEKLYFLFAALLKGVGKHSGTADEKFNPEELKKGIKVEMEHTDNLYVAKLIAKDHLVELPDYYTRLAKMEKTAPSDEREKEEFI